MPTTKEQSMMIQAIIVDDEIKSGKNLERLILDYCPNVQVLALCQSVDEGIAAIALNRPDLVFLDVEMKGETGFDLLTKIGRIDFEVVFATAHSEYALKAFRFSAIDYLLKPFDIADLREAIERVDQKKKNNLKSATSNLDKLAISSSTGIVFVAISDIVYCEAEGNYTTFYTANKKKYVASRTLKVYEELLAKNNFVRIHDSFLINLGAIKKYIRSAGEVIMSNEVALHVSKRKKDSFLQKITEYTSQSVSAR